jgi:amino acid transporter
MSEERLNIPLAMAVLSSDALSSVSYATEELMIVLLLAGTTALHYSIPIAIAISALIVVVILSYHQVVRVYAAGGGSYHVAKENLGEYFGLIAAAGLLISYVLTVSVSVAAGISAIIAAVPQLENERVLLGLLAIAIITLINIRGIRESGHILLLPVYGFIISMFAMIGVGLWRYFDTGVPAEEVSGLPAAPLALQGVTLFLLLRAFSSAGTALTGIEAISNAVPNFKKPEADNARKTLLLLGIVLVSLFMGVTFLTYKFGIIPRENQTVVAQVAKAAFGGGVGFYLIQSFIALILLLAANTSYVGFPRLASILGRDNYMPRQLANLGDRLVYSNGIIVLGIISGLLLAAFGGSVHRLIPMYAIGVFIGFSLTQIGMVKHWQKVREKGWKLGLLINGVGGLVTMTVALIFLVTQFMAGAWLVILMLPLLVMAFISIKRHYLEVGRELSLDSPEDSFEPHDHKVIVPVGAIHRAVIPAIRYAKSISRDVTAVYVAADPESASRMRERWNKVESGIPLVIINSPYRFVIKPLIEYIDAAAHSSDDSLVTVVIPEFVPHMWWQQILHNQTALFIKAALLFKRRIVVTSVPFHLRK